MTIDRSNYETYIIDWIDGNLDVETTQELMLFFALNKDLEEEAMMLEQSILTSDTAIVYNDKPSLKKNNIESINLENYTHFLVAKIENDLSENENEELNSFLKLHPQTEKELRRFEATKLVADTSIFYPNKNELKHQTKIIWLNYKLAAAAILLIMLSLPFLIKTFNSDKNTVAIKPMVAVPSNNNKSVEDDVKQVNRVLPVVGVLANHTKAVKKENRIETLGKGLLPEPTRLSVNVQANNNKSMAPNKIENITLQPIATNTFQLNKINLENAVTFKNKAVEENAFSNFYEDENKVKVQNETEYLNLKQASIKAIKDIASSAQSTEKGKTKNYATLHWTDLAAFVAAKINANTGTKIYIEKTFDELGNAHAIGIKANGFEIARR